MLQAGWKRSGWIVMGGVELNDFVCEVGSSLGIFLTLQHSSKPYQHL